MTQNTVLLFVQIALLTIKIKKNVVLKQGPGQENVDKENERITTAAARLIQLEIKDREYSKHSYPTNQDISNSTETEEWLPPLLHSLMKILVRDDLKQNAIAQSIVQAARPRSVISLLLFSLGVELDHLYGSELLVTKLA